ncbi:MAG: Xaa-Pro peptidase family protein [Spirochaetaceae bacterium]|nr:Xaa-Pro peptidase family protein [Spirochaetaceae bacterium]
MEELLERRRGFCSAMTRRYPGWQTAVFTDAVNQYYLTGTIQDGVVFVVRRHDDESRLVFGVRRSFSRAREESPLFDSAGIELLQIHSYRDMAEKIGADLGVTYVEGDTLSLAVLERLKKYFTFSVPSGGAGFLDQVIREVRSVKSEAEIAVMRRCGEAHRILMEEHIPRLLREGISEAEFLGEVCGQMFKLGYQGITRFHQCQSELCFGQIGFGTNSLYPSMFDGPGGAKGNCAASPFGADGKRRLKKGDAVFVDLGFAMDGYHTDKTQVYFLGEKPPIEFIQVQQFCLDLQKQIAEKLVPGAIPSKIYGEIMESLSPAQQDCFMGVDNLHRVKFLGHGVGLDTDELPVIAKSFDAPLVANMTLAIEPKKAIPGAGMFGVEDTFLVTEHGGECITGAGRDIICL